MAITAKKRLVRINWFSKRQTFAYDPSEKIDNRLGHVQKQVDELLAIWRVEDYTSRTNDCEDEFDVSFPCARRVLLFHIAAILKINEPYLEAVDENKMTGASYYKHLHQDFVC